MSKRTLLILTPGFPADEADTTCLPFLQSHVRALNNEFPDLEVIIIAFQYPYFRRTYLWHGNQVVCMGGKGRGNLRRILLWTKVWRKLARFKREKDIVGLFSLWCGECALVAHEYANIHNLKHLIWLCGQDAKKGNKYVKRINPKDSELIAMSDFLRKEFYGNHGILPAHTIPIGVDTSQFSQKPSQRHIDILGVGSLIPLKQYDIFIDVVRELREHEPSVKAVLCGQGPEESKLKSLISAHGLEKNVSLAGEVPHAEVLQLMQQSKVFLHTSNYEGFGTVCLEALYAGAQVVSFTKPMDREIAHWRHVNNKEEMAIAVMEVLKDKNSDHLPVIPYTTSGIAIEIMELFDVL